MNLRPPGYEPGELPDCSTPRRGMHCITVELWIPLAFLILAVAGSLVHAALRGWALWRAFRRTSRRVNRGLAHVAGTAADLLRGTGMDTREMRVALGPYPGLDPLEGEG